MKTLSDKVAVVTGAGSGIGRATAIALAARGASVAICDVDERAAKDAADAVVAAHGVASVHSVDVSDETAVRALVSQVIGKHGVVDIVVNNAGIASGPSRAVDLSLEDFQRILAVNLWGVVHGSLGFLPELLRRPEASLVNVASNAGLIGVGRMAPYVTSKFAVRGFTESLRMELRSSPVRVSLVCPGATHTAIMAHSPVLDARQRAALQQATDRTWGRPPEAVAHRIITTILKGRPRTIVGPDSMAVDCLTRLMPGRYSSWVGPAVDKFVDGALGRLPSDRTEPTTHGGQ